MSSFLRARYGLRNFSFASRQPIKPVGGARPRNISTGGGSDRVAALKATGLITGLALVIYNTNRRPVLTDVEPDVPLLSRPAFGSAPTQPVALDLAAANEKLRQEEYTHSFYAGHGRVGTTHIARLASNYPVEDQFAVSASLSPWTTKNFNIAFFGVYDGHAGWATSAYLREHLIPWISENVGRLPKDSPPKVITDTISNAMVSMDDKIMQSALKRVKGNTPEADAETVAALAPAVAGSCAILAGYEADTSMLRVACTGDSRAVLGQYSSELGMFETSALSEDHSGRSKSEIARLIAEHPDEPEMVKGLENQGRIFGLACTRAFGDHRWKLDTETLKTIQQKYFGSLPRPHAKTPPYVTARPVMTETVVKTGGKDKQGNKKPSFAILATDGLWDHMSSEDAVKCVEGWIEAKTKAKASLRQDVATPAPPAGGSDSPILKTDDGYADWQYKKEWFVAEDDNAATHLVRNVLGGKNRGMFCGIMSAYAPMSRNVRDDITVQVIFFESAP